MTLRYPLLGLVTVAILFGMPLNQHGSAHARTTRVVSLTSDTLTSTSRSLHGARSVITKQFPEAEFVSFNLTGKSESDAKILDSARRLQPQLILTVGTRPTQIAKEALGEFPIVFSSVVHPELSGIVSQNGAKSDNVSGASLDIPLDVQFKYFKQIVPSIKRIGVLYTQSTASVVEKAQKVAANHGLQFVPARVSDSKDLGAVLDSLAPKIDGLWSIPDQTLFNPKSTRFILLNTIRKAIPVMGFSRNVVESGALFALDFDYKAVGIQAGQIANRVLLGEKASQIPVTTVDVIWFHYNENTAQLINVTVPEELMAIAKEVYR